MFTQERHKGSRGTQPLSGAGAGGGHLDHPPLVGFKLHQHPTTLEQTSVEVACLQAAVLENSQPATHGPRGLSWTMPSLRHSLLKPMQLK